MSSFDEENWYPSVVVKMTMRFDEALQVAGTGDDDPSASTTQQSAAANPLSRVTNGTADDTVFGPRQTDENKEANKRSRPRRALDAVRDAAHRANAALSNLDQLTTPDGVVSRPGSKYAPAGGQVTTALPLAAGGNLSPLGYGTDGFTVICNRVPNKGSFKQPHPRSAATFTLAFDYAEFPIDPRILRAVGVEIHVGTVSADDYARGMAGQTDTDGRPFSILKTTTDVIDPFSGRPSSNASTLLFYATADTWEVEHTENGSTITLEGRDVRGIFLDAKIALGPIAKLDLSKPINRVVEDIIHTMGTDIDLRFSVMTDVNEWPNGIVPSPGDAAGLTRVRMAAAGDKASGTPSNGAKANYWDLITNYCTIVGAMPVMHGSAIWIRPTHSIFDIASPSSAVRTPFNGGRTREASPGGEQFRIRRLVYGRDLKRLKFTRKFAGAVVPTIKTISFDDQAQGLKRLIFGQWPPAASAQAKVKADTEVLTVPLYGLRSVEALTQAARGIYEEVGRGETGGTADTECLASFGGSNADPDILRAKPMEPIEFLIDARALKSQAPLVSELTDNERRSFAEEVDLLHTRIGDRLVARALVAMARGAIRELLAYYQVIEVNTEWTTEGGIKTQFAFQNYIVPRNRVNNDPPAVVSPPNIEGRTVKTTGADKKAKVTTLPPQHNQVPTSMVGGGGKGFDKFRKALAASKQTPSVKPPRPRSKLDPP